MATIGGGALGGGLLGGIGTGMQALGAVNDLFGPKGALVTGDFSKGAGAVNTLGSGIQGVSDWWNKPVEVLSPTTQSAIGLSPEQFKQIDPKTGQSLLRQATIGGGFKGDDIGAFGLSPDEFNSIPPEVRQELLRKLTGR